ncbi:hypothetical protein JCM10908_007199 [Rhodotorula pacifica]|uniref:uncharacterized protein n=1 Tax=Rhodotorula pacifica TaxID=1495444 RepID=UPI00317C11CD
MFTSFSQGADHSGDWNEESAYLPGRFRAHPRPTSPSPSESRAPSVRNLGLSALTLASSDAPPIPPKRENKRARALKRTLDALSPDRRRRQGVEAEREGLLSPWLARSAVEPRQSDSPNLTAAAERSPILPTPRHEFLRARYSAQPDGPASPHEDDEDRGILRPGRRKVEGWMASWWRRWFLLVWLWAAVPFPVSDPYKEEPPWHLPWPPSLISTLPLAEDLPVDANFLFFLFFYYGGYLAIALIFVTKLFDLFRLNWWPRSLGGSVSYISFWSLALVVGYLLHKFRLDGFRPTGRPSRSGDASSPAADFDWQRKTTWVLLAFATMALPAFACFAKLRADRRNSYRRSLTPAQKTFLERPLTQRMPRSYRRFLWFLGVIGLTLLALIVGQGFATIYLSTLPHSSFDGLVYVWTWIATVNVLWAISSWILVRKVRSQALICVFRFYYFLLYYVFYRTLFARLRSPDQAVYITLLSSVLVVAWYPISMSKTCWRVMRRTVGVDVEWEEYAVNRGTELYIRNLSENVTMVAFLGWVTILHLGPNKPIYPFFAFDDPNDPYTFRLTLSASAVIFAAELFAGYLARIACWLAYEIDVTNLGLDQFREYPELVIACIFTACHVLSDMLFFLVKLNFR